MLRSSGAEYARIGLMPPLQQVSSSVELELPMGTAQVCNTVGGSGMEVAKEQDAVAMTFFAQPWKRNETIDFSIRWKIEK